MKLFQNPVQQIGYALKLPSQYMLKYLSHHIQLLGKKFLRTYRSVKSTPTHPKIPLKGKFVWIIQGCLW